MNMNVEIKGNKLDLRERKQLKLFAVITFGLTVLMGIVMGFGFHNGTDVSTFPVAQMLYPAAGVMLALMLTRQEGQKLPVKFFAVYLVVTGVIVLLTLAGVLISELAFVMYMAQQYVCIIGSILAWIMLLCEKKEVRDSFCLRFGGHRTSKSLLLMLLFFGIYMLRVLVSYMAGGSLEELKAILTDTQTWVMLVIVIVNFYLSFMIFFGEEYGWRYFLQPLLQKRFGKKAGILLLGVVWGLWHLPINVYYYSPETCIQSILIQLITCISFSIFFGWAYMKTNNIWVPVVMHYINNNMAAVLTQSADFSNNVYSWWDVLFTLILNGVIFVPFLFTREYREEAVQSDIQ